MWTKIGWSIIVAIAGFYAPAGLAQIPELTEPTVVAQRSNSGAADASYQRGFELFRKGTAASLREAIPYYEEAARLYEQAGNPAQQALSLLGTGFIYNALGEKQTALEYYEQALPLFQAVGDRSLEATTLNNIGLVYSDLGEKQRALEYYERSLPLSRAVGDRSVEAVTLSNIGMVYSDLGEKQTALEYLEQALPLLQAVGDRSREATTLNNIGLVYSDLGEKQTALEYYEQALPLFQAVGDRSLEATTLNNIGLVYHALGEKQTALEYYERALPLSRAVGDRTQEARTLNNIGAVYDALGEKRRALEYYERALPLSRAVGDRTQEAITLNNIGAVYDALGEKRRALEYYERALPLSRAVGDRTQEARTLNNIGKVYDDLGEKRRALEYYEQALPLFQAVGDRSGEATTLNNIGAVYDALGEKQTALEYLEQALPLLQAVGDRSGEATTLSNIGKVYDDLGEKQTALEYYEQALPLRRAVGDRSGEATTLNNIGRVYDALGEKQTALEYLEQALPLFQAVGDRSGEAVILTGIGTVYDDFGEKQTALEYYERALPLSRAVGDRSGEATTLYNIAFLQRSQGSLTEALANMEQAIGLTEELRSLAPSGELRQTFFSTVQGRYRFYIELLMQLHRQDPDRGYDAEALHASERSRARTLLELLREANADIRQGVDPELVAEERRLQQKLDAAETRRLEIFGDDNSTRTQKENIEAELAELLKQYEEIRARIRTASPRYATLTQPQPLTLAEVQQQVVDEETVLLQYSLGEESSYLWVVTPTEMTVHELPGREEIEAKADAFLYAITSVTRRHNPRWVNTAAQELSEMILQPAASQLQQKRLLISADGVLQNIPFSALTISRGEDYEPLIEQYEIVRSPSASAIAQIRQDTASRTPATKTLAVFADPVFTPDDERVKTPVAAAPPDGLLLAAIPDPRGETRDAVDGWARLEYTRTEAETILGLVPETESTAAFDFDANLEAILNSEELQDYQIIHFATHGFANGRNPALSGLVFSLIDEGGNWQNGYLRLNDIFNLNLPAELVVLSACQTALGRDLEGEGMVGITRGFMYAGSPRLVASLWFVDDLGTSVLMSKFYQKMLSENLSPLEAMRSAQLEMLASSEYNSPYYWAGFTFQGEWNESAGSGE